MIDPDLERRLADCSELMDSWRRFLDLINQAVKPPNNTSPQAEQQFLNAKARIAMLHDSFTGSLKHDKATASNMIEIVNRCITLRLLLKLSESETKKMEIEWHEVFLLLNETVSGLNEEKARLSQINEYVYRAKKLKETAIVRSRALLGSIYLKIAIVLVVLGFLIWGVPALGLYDWDDLRDITALKGTISFLNKLGRNQMNLQRPFTDVNQFYTSLNKVVPGVAQPEDFIKYSREEAIPAVISQMGLGPPVEPAQTTDVLSKASGFKAVSVKQDGSEYRAYLFMFWFRKTDDAKAFERTVVSHKQTIPETYEVYRKVNVIIVLRADTVELRDRVRAGGIDVTPPVRSN